MTQALNSQGQLHTAGPWRAVADEQTPERGCVYIAARGRFEAEETIAEAYKTDADVDDGCLDETEANARLIAAAPDLYKALSALVAAYDRHPGIGVESLRKEFSAARAALAIARQSSDPASGDRT